MYHFSQDAFDSGIKIFWESVKVLCKVSNMDALQPQTIYFFGILELKVTKIPFFSSLCLKYIQGRELEQCQPPEILREHRRRKPVFFWGGFLE